MDVCDRRRWRMKGAKKEWQRSKFCKANSEQKISGTLAGHNGADSKGSRPRHLRMCESSRFRRFSRKCFIFLEFWMNAFSLRPCKSRAKFKQLNIRRDIEVVITRIAGGNSDDSKGRRAYHLMSRESSCFLAISLKCFIFLEFWMNAFHHRPCKSRAKFKNNFICRGIEAVITGLTRNQFAGNSTRVRIPPSAPKDRSSHELRS